MFPLLLAVGDRDFVFCRKPKEERELDYKIREISCPLICKPAVKGKFIIKSEISLSLSLKKRKNTKPSLSFPAKVGIKNQDKNCVFWHLKDCRDIIGRDCKKSVGD